MRSSARTCFRAGDRFGHNSDTKRSLWLRRSKGLRVCPSVCGATIPQGFGGDDTVGSSAPARRCWPQVPACCPHGIANGDTPGIMGGGRTTCTAALVATIDSSTDCRGLTSRTLASHLEGEESAWRHGARAFLGIAWNFMGGNSVVFREVYLDSLLSHSLNDLPPASSLAGIFFADLTRLPYAMFGIDRGRSGFRSCGHRRLLHVPADHQ